MPALIVIILCLFVTSCSTPLQFTKNREITLSSKGPLRLNEINGPAAEDFMNRFPGENSVVWFRTDYGYLARQVSGKMHSEIHYSQHGAFIKEITYYDEGSIPESVGLLMSKKFPSYSITSMASVTDSKTLLYQVSIRNSETLKTVAISGNETEVLYEMKNGIIAYR